MSQPNQRKEFPCSTYELLTKVGRYGPNAADFDYSRDAICHSVRHSLCRLHRQYLDVVYGHDIVFVASCVAHRAQGNHAATFSAEAAAYGLTESHASRMFREYLGQWQRHTG